MSEVNDTVNEEIKEADQIKDEPKAEEIKETVKEEPKKEETPKEETPKEEPPKEEEEFKNKTDRMKNKKVKCEGCQAEMTLKTLRYSHKCNGKTEDKPIKPKSKTRAVTVKPIENKVIKTVAPTRVKEVVSQSEHEPIEVKTKEKPVRMEEPEQPPSRTLTARELLEASYMEIRRAKQQEQTEKIARFKTSMF